MKKAKKVLFVCKHNIFRSKVAEAFFKKLNKNPNYYAESAGLIRWDYADTKDDLGFIAEKKVAKKFGIDLKGNARSITSGLLRDASILVIVANNVPSKFFSGYIKEKLFNGKIIVWKIRDVSETDKNKEAIALASINSIKKKSENFVRSLK